MRASGLQTIVEASSETGAPGLVKTPYTSTADRYKNQVGGLLNVTTSSPANSLHHYSTRTGLQPRKKLMLFLAFVSKPSVRPSSLQYHNVLHHLRALTPS